MRGHRVDTSLGVLYFPQIDRYRATVLERAEVNAAILWGLGERWTLGARGNYGRTLSGPLRGESGWLLDLNGAYRISRVMLAEAGLRSAWQPAQNPAVPTNYQWLFYLALTVGTRGSY